MSNWTARIACVLLAVAPAAYADKDQETVAVNANEMKWTTGPPGLPKGALMAVLHGDPKKPGTFTMQYKLPDGWKVPPHWHSREEQLTVLSGALELRMGDNMDKAHVLEAGGCHFLPAKTRHAAQTKGETVVQINGNGPFDIHYVNPADNPNPKSVRR